MYDLMVDAVHTFAVGDGQWVVHNTNSICTTFHRPDLNSDIAYRNPRSTELSTVETIGFYPKDPTATVKPGAHVYGPVDQTQYVSFSRNIIWSAYYQGIGFQKHGVKNPFYVVNLNLAQGRIIDFTDPIVFNHELKHPVARHWALRAGEVLVEGHMPADGIIARIDYDHQFVTAATAIVNRGLKEGWWSKGGSWHVR